MNQVQLPLSGGEYETLWCLFLHGPTWDGDVPSKSDRDSLVRKGLAERGKGHQWLNRAGVELALELGFEIKKSEHERKRRKEQP